MIEKDVYRVMKNGKKMKMIPVFNAWNPSSSVMPTRFDNRTTMKDGGMQLKTLAKGIGSQLTWNERLS